MQPNETERARQLTALTERLTEIVSSEIEALQSRRPKDITEFEEEKTRLARIFATETQRLKSDPNLVRVIPREVLAALRQAAARFREVTARQEAMLLALKTVSERMIRDIASELNRMKAPERGYGRSASPYAAHPAAPFALNSTA